MPRTNSRPAKQTTRMLKLSCNTCAWTCRTTRRHIPNPAVALDNLHCPVTQCVGQLETN